MVANTNLAFALSRAVELLIIIFNQELIQTSVHQQETFDDSLLVNKIINGVKVCFKSFVT